LGYFWASFDRLSGENFHADLATPLAYLAVAAAVGRTGRYNQGGPVTVTPGIAVGLCLTTARIAYCGCPATLEKEFEVVDTLADFSCCC